MTILSNKIEKIELYKITLPLTVPYKLSYGVVRRLQSIWAKIELNDGRFGWGESTPLPGYTETSISEVEKSCKKMADYWNGKKIAKIWESIDYRINGFQYCALVLALESAIDRIPKVSGSIPIAGLVQEQKKERPDDAIARVRMQGYKIFKVKVGFLDTQCDVDRLISFQNSLFSGERIRIDANQKLDLSRAKRMIKVCKPNKVELFEQPLCIDSWKESSLLKEESNIPIMLDEAIVDENSLKMTAETKAADIVKFKLMKMGSYQRMAKLTTMAEDLGLKVILGNGVASHLDNWFESVFWLDRLQHMDLAGEMNGFLKLHRSNDSGNLKFDSGKIRIAESVTLNCCDYIKEKNISPIAWYGKKSFG